MSRRHYRSDWVVTRRPRLRQSTQVVTAGAGTRGFSGGTSGGTPTLITATTRSPSRTPAAARAAASAGQNGQFRTARHIIRLMVEMTAPQPADVICDPACGTAGFLVAAGEHLREHHPNVLHDPALARHFRQRMFHGFDFDNTMLDEMVRVLEFVRATAIAA